MLVLLLKRICLGNQADCTTIEIKAYIHLTKNLEKTIFQFLVYDAVCLHLQAE